jgi:hypothetical protein
MPYYVELITTNPDGSVKTRSPCGHKHRALEAAKRCVKRKTAGIPARGGENIGVLYEDDKPIIQARVLQDVKMRGGVGHWRAFTELVGPGSTFWRDDLGES